MIFGGAVYETIDQGQLDYDASVGVIRKNKDAKAAFESLYEFPLLNTNLVEHLQSDKIKAFLKKYSLHKFKNSYGFEVDQIEYTILSLSCFGGTPAKDVELIYEERTFTKEPFMFPPEGIRYREGGHIQYAEGAPIQSEQLPYNRKQVVMKLGDIEPGRGRNIPIQIALRPEQVANKSINFEDFVVAISSFHLKPLRIRFKTLSGEVIEQPIREQLNMPMPVSDFIDGRG